MSPRPTPATVHRQSSRTSRTTPAPSSSNPQPHSSAQERHGPPPCPRIRPSSTDSTKSAADKFTQHSFSILTEIGKSRRYSIHQKMPGKGKRMQNNDQQQDDLWIKQSLGAASNWEKLAEADQASLRKAAAWYAIIAIGLAVGVGILSFTILQDGAKATLVTSSLAIIGAVFPAAEKVVSGSMEYFESTNEKLHVAKLKLMRSYFNLYALILVGAALLDFIAAAFLGLWQ